MNIETKASESGITSKGNLLIIDDEPFILKTLKFSLSDYADNIFTANNGKEALELIAANEIHCVVCDINMPVMNGVEVITKLREEKNDVPFIFYTGHGNNELMMEAVKFGAFDFLNKPQLEGIEEVVVNGLRAGQKQGIGTESESDFMSEYKKLLLQLEEKDQDT